MVMICYSMSMSKNIYLYTLSVHMAMQKLVARPVFLGSFRRTHAAALLTSRACRHGLHAGWGVHAGQDRRVAL